MLNSWVSCRELDSAGIVIQVSKGLVASGLDSKIICHILDEIKY
jgi:hypothetical protein